MTTSIENLGPNHVRVRWIRPNDLVEFTDLPVGETLEVPADVIEVPTVHYPSGPSEIETTEVE